MIFCVDVNDVRWKFERRNPVAFFLVIIILCLGYVIPAGSSFSARPSEPYRPHAAHLYSQRPSADGNTDGTKTPELPGGGPCKIVNRRINREQSIMRCPGNSRCVIPDPRNDPRSDIEVYVCSDDRTVETLKITAAFDGDENDDNQRR